MQAKLPEDLVKIRVWCTDAIQAIWDLHRARDGEAMRAARKQLFALVDGPPELSEELDRELMRASNAHREERPRMRGVTARHVVDAVWRNCVLALRIVHASSMRAIRNQVDMWRHDPPAQRPSDYAAWEKALAVCRAISDDPSRLTDPKYRKTLDESYAQFPVPLWVPPDGPPLPMTIPVPAGELAVWVEQVLTRVRDDRANWDSSVAALNSRTPPKPHAAHERHGLEINEAAREAFFDGQQLEINAHSDFDLLSILHEQLDKVVPHDTLAKKLKPGTYTNSTEITKAPPEVFHAIKHIRKAFERVSAPFEIKAVRNKGYKLCQNPVAPPAAPLPR